MARNLKRQKFKFYFPKKILWNPFAYLDKKARQLPKNVLIALVFFIAAMAALKSENQKSELRTLGLQTRINANQETIYQWEQILQERPDYRDGWVQLSASYYKSGNKQKAKEALKKAIEIDPNNESLLSFEKLIQ